MTPNIITLDIETIGPLARVWGLRQQDIGLTQIIEQSRVLGFGAKPYGKPVEWRSEFHDGREKMIERAWQILDEADVVIGWNSTPFDVPWLKREFVVAGMKPPSPFQQIDLIKTVRREFRFESNKLQNVSTMLGLPGKLQHNGMSLWLGCLAGDPKAWALMRRYCKQDVVLTEQLYDVLRPWVNGPNMALVKGVAGLACDACGSTSYQSRGVARTKQSAYQRYQCQDCGHWFRSVRSLDRAQTTGVVT